MKDSGFINIPLLSFISESLVITTGGLLNIFGRTYSYLLTGCLVPCAGILGHFLFIASEIMFCRNIFQKSDASSQKMLL